ncbi:GAP family protein [Mycolicibacterium sp. GF69]|uniref:GAP family protein n=1 Tax=Mycolicibacterium sp. GF69 TaxID=2267251 RepID=UPI000DCCD007|nr:GAP family protein [Mycolicibacterium sp. GF69]RAV13507.1 GAP family protein [Mycolicibacterium sp. GF69]
MWGSVLVLGLLTGLNPVRIGIALLVVSRPRPVQNLLVYGAGCLTACVIVVAVPLTLMHATPMFEPFVDGFATSTIVRHGQIGLGVLALSIAAMLTAHSLMRRRRQADVLRSGGKTSTLVMNSPAPSPVTRLLGHAQDAPSEGSSAIRRLLRPLRDAWANGSLWVSFVIGFGFGGVEPDAGLFLLAFILTSGAGIGAQIIAGIAFIVGILAVVEITLISYVVAPAKTQAALQRLHDFALAHHRMILIAMCLLGGAALVARGLVSG